MRNLLLLPALTAAVALLPAGEVPMGAPAFHPSPERPVGWRGDGSGAFPGATPVAAWNSQTGQGIAWKCRMPTPSWSQPIVVGDKVFTTADPNLLICVSAVDGTILWQHRAAQSSIQS